MKTLSTVLTALLLTALSGACTWVKPEPGAEAVAVTSTQAVAGCQRLGKVTVSVRNRVAAVERKATKVETELATLARNEAAPMGGDTVAAESPVAEGRQVYGVYRCRT